MEQKHHAYAITLLAAAILALLFAGGIVGSERASASPAQQPTPFLTPTPGPDGRIVYIVKEGDSLWRIAAIAGIEINELMAMNGIQPGDFISPGMELELGVGGPVLPTPAPPGFRPTATSPPLTATPATGAGEICALLFVDLNGNGRLEEGESPLPGGQISVVDVSGALSAEHATDDSPEGFCFQDLTSGDYSVSAAVPPEYNPTTGLSAPVSLKPGDIKYLQFGAQPSAALLGGQDGEGDSRSLILGLLGVALLIAAGGTGYYASRLARRTPRSLR